MISVVFVSNYFNHHQKLFCDEMYNILGKDNFYFIETIPIPEERVKLGYSVYREPYVISLHQHIELFKKTTELIKNADIVIFGEADRKLLKERNILQKTTFFYSERINKKRVSFIKMIYRFFSLRRYIKKNSYLLCASAYAYSDYYKLGLFRDKSYKWGYFSQNQSEISPTELLNRKNNNQVLWVGRLIDCKHPIFAIQTVERLVADGFDLHLKIVGDGILKDELTKYTIQHGLTNIIEFVGKKNVADVFKIMEESEFFLFTSDFQEGWGAVLGEAMSCGCIPISSHAPGSAPFLIKNFENGFLYRNDSLDNLYNVLKSVLLDKKRNANIAKNAISTIRDVWSAKIAANRFVILAEKIMNNEKFAFEDGPCSKAKKIDNNWFE